MLQQNCLSGSASQNSYLITFIVRNHISLRNHIAPLYLMLAVRHLFNDIYPDKQSNPYNVLLV